MALVMPSSVPKQVASTHCCACTSHATGAPRLSQLSTSRAFKEVSLGGVDGKLSGDVDGKLSGDVELSGQEVWMGSFRIRRCGWEDLSLGGVDEKLPGDVELSG